MKTRLLVMLPILLGLLSCSGSDDPVAPDNAPKWQRIFKAPKGLNGIWGASPSHVFVVGREGSNYQFDGATWVTADAQTLSNFRATSGIAANDVYAVGDDGIARRFLGDQWSLESSGATGYIGGVWAGVSVYYAVGFVGQIFSVSGSAWMPMTSNTTQNLWGVHGINDNIVFAVGDGGTIMYYDGTDWTQMTSNTTMPLYDVFALTASDVWAVGAGGTIVHYDGSNWAVVASGTQQTLRAVWAAGTNAVFAGGANGVVLRWSTKWDTMTSNTTSNITDLWGSSLNNVYAVTDNGSVMRFAIP